MDSLHGIRGNLSQHEQNGCKCSNYGGTGRARSIFGDSHALKANESARSIVEIEIILYDWARLGTIIVGASLNSHAKALYPFSILEAGSHTIVTGLVRSWRFDFSAMLCM